MKNKCILLISALLLMSLLAGKPALAVEANPVQGTVRTLIRSEADLADALVGVVAGQDAGQSNGSGSRRGTENWEQSQSNFFVIPGLVIAVAAIAYFFNRKE